MGVYKCLIQNTFNVTSVSFQKLFNVSFCLLFFNYFSFFFLSSIHQFFFVFFLARHVNNIRLYFSFYFLYSSPSVFLILSCVFDVCYYLTIVKLQCFSSYTQFFLLFFSFRCMVVARTACLSAFVNASDFRNFHLHMNPDILRFIYSICNVFKLLLVLQVVSMCCMLYVRGVIKEFRELRMYIRFLHFFLLY